MLETYIKKKIFNIFWVPTADHQIATLRIDKNKKIVLPKGSENWNYFGSCQLNPPLGCNFVSLPRSHQFSSYGWYTGTALSNFTRIASQAGALRKAQGYVVINKDINGVGKSLCRCGLRIFGPKCPFSLSQLLNPPRDMFGFCQLLAWQGMDTSITPRPNK